MAVIKLNVVVGNLDSVRASFDSIKIYRSITGVDGTYVEITDVATRPYLEAGKLVYSFTDELGSEDYWYKSSYFRSIS
jgi:hypothetical protein